MATQSISAPLSPTSPPTTPRSPPQDNDFQFATKAWPTAVPALPSVGSLPGVALSSSLHSRNGLPQSPPPPPPLLLPTVTSSSPLPPRSGSGVKQQYQASPAAKLGPQSTKSSSRENGTNNTMTIPPNAKDIRHPRLSSAERTLLQPTLTPTIDGNNEVWKIQRTASISRTVNSTLLRSRDPAHNSSSLVESLSASSLRDDGIEGMESWMTPNNNAIEPDYTEQALFEERLTEDMYGVAVRKIANNGKSSLRYVRCMYIDSSELDTEQSSSRSLSSQSRRFYRFRGEYMTVKERRESLLKGNKVKVLCWGNKKEVKVPVDKFICVRMGKTTDRTRRNISPAIRLLSLISEDQQCPSLDIEAPTKIDRDKFARAFARFLNIPLEGDDSGSGRTEDRTLHWKEPPKSSTVTPVQHASSIAGGHQIPKSSASVGQGSTSQSVTSLGPGRIPLPVINADNQHRPVSATRNPIVPPPQNEAPAENGSELPRPLPLETTPTRKKGEAGGIVIPEESSTKERGGQEKVPSATLNVTDEDASVVSSMTGAGYDQDLLEELHLALTKMKKELDESRAEAARAVKVAEQAIQSAEKSTSKDWNTTVTHKAAEAAALAQKRSAEALATARLAEERFEQEKKKAATWRRQAEAAIEEAGQWQTRASVAEVQRASMAELLQSHRNMYSPTTPSNPAPGSELERLRSKLAAESATRKKLLGEVQDLRGQIRVYCRVRPPNGTSVVSVVSKDIMLLHRERSSLRGDEVSTPLSFEFDGILDTDASQEEVYSEVEGVCSSALDGFNSCILTHGQTGAGKTYTLLGDVSYDGRSEVSIGSYGIHLQATREFFSVIDQRRDRYEDIVTFSVVEVSNERLSDLLAGTESLQSSGVVANVDTRSRKGSNSYEGTSHSDKPSAMEIKTSRDGETVVNGLLWVKVTSFEDVLSKWKECLKARRRRRSDQSLDYDDHRRNSHVVATYRITSRNIATGVSTVGKIQFVDLASSNIIRPSSNGRKPSTADSVVEEIEPKYTNRSIGTLSEVMTARSRYQRSVPYRNAAITHLLSDSLEHDTKVVLVACVSSDLQDLQDTASVLKFAQITRKVVIGKATKHTKNSII